MRARAVVLAVALVMAPLGAKAADLVVWWQKGAYAQEDEALREIIAAFEQGSGKRVELILYPDEELPGKIEAVLAEGQPPDFAFSVDMGDYISEWAFDDRLVDLTDTVGSFSTLFDPDALPWFALLNDKTKQRALYALPIGRTTNHIHVWKSLLEQAGFTLDDIPEEWEAFWSFWCDQVQPAVRRATGRDDIWGIGLNMSAQVSETTVQFFQFLAVIEDTEGLVAIAFGKTAAEVREGLRKCSESLKASPEREVAESFYEIHERRAWRRLLQLER
jgi:multiple sugar transport system substrate-binding protein